jgi:hypothetical protein
MDLDLGGFAIAISLCAANNNHASHKQSDVCLWLACCGTAASTAERREVYYYHTPGISR